MLIIFLTKRRRSIKLSMLAFYIRCFALHRTRIWVYLIAATQIIATIVANTVGCTFVTSFAMSF